MATRISSDEFQRVLDGAIRDMASEIEALRSECPDVEAGMSFEDWWQHLSTVVVPELLIVRGPRPGELQP